jgi:hypothetical protein
MKRVFWSSVIATFVLAAAASSYLHGTPDLRASDDGIPRRLPVGPETPEPARAEPIATAAEAPAAEQSQHSQLLETIGTLTSAHYYQTYLNIGLIADGKARGTYTEADAVKVLESVLSLLKSVDRKLEALGKMDLGKEDRESLKEMRALSALLRQQGEELQVLWVTGKEEDAAKYEQTRKTSWTAVSRLMGIGQ